MCKKTFFLPTVYSQILPTANLNTREKVDTDGNRESIDLYAKETTFTVNT